MYITKTLTLCLIHPLNFKVTSFKLPEIVPHFTVIPPEIELRPWTAVTYIFRGQSNKIGKSDPASRIRNLGRALGGVLVRAHRNITGYRAAALDCRHLHLPRTVQQDR
jgi:hypothetical protein